MALTANIAVSLKTPKLSLRCSVLAFACLHWCIWHLLRDLKMEWRTKKRINLKPTGDAQFRATGLPLSQRSDTCSDARRRESPPGCSPFPVDIRLQIS